MNTPNKLTLLRIILVVPFAVVMGLFLAATFTNGQASYSEMNLAAIYLLIAGVIFALAMITDFIDGKLARKNNQVTTFGKLFDPLADKFMTTTAFIMLSVANIVPWWLTLVFVLRDILVDGSRNLAAKNNVQVAASFWGKAKTMLQSVGLVLIFFVYPAYNFGTCTELMGGSFAWELFLLNLPVIISGVLSIVSGYQYFKNIVPYINTK